MQIVFFLQILHCEIYISGAMQSMHASQEEALTAHEDDGANVYIYSVCVDEVRW